MDFMLCDTDRPIDLEDLECDVDEDEDEDDDEEVLESADEACTGLVDIQNCRANKVSTFRASIRVS